MLSSFFESSLQGVVAIKTPAAGELAAMVVCEQELKQTASKTAAEKSLMSDIETILPNLKRVEEERYKITYKNMIS